MVFVQLFFLGNIGHKNVSYDILQRKNAFLAYKIKKFKSRKIHIFPKGLAHSFGPKMAISPTFLGQYRPGKFVLRYSRTKENAFLDYENKIFKKWKI